jgi:hypothetical protein
MHKRHRVETLYSTLLHPLVAVVGQDLMLHLLVVTVVLVVVEALAQAQHLETQVGPLVQAIRPLRVHHKEMMAV